MNAIGALSGICNPEKSIFNMLNSRRKTSMNFTSAKMKNFSQFIAGFLEVGANYYIRPLCRIGLGIDYNDQRKAIAGPRRNKNNCTICLKTLEDFPMEEMQKLYSEYMTQRAGR